MSDEGGRACAVREVGGAALRASNEIKLRGGTKDRAPMALIGMADVY